MITREGCLKIADWGLARSFYTADVKYTNRVITLWYRPPELLLGTEQYSTPVDMWSIGYRDVIVPVITGVTDSVCRCLFAEMKCRKAILRGKDEANQVCVCLLCL